MPPSRLAPPLQIVLVAPEIPQNTGSIARTCAATGARLHLIRPLGFSLDDRYLKRAGLDYWPHVDLTIHDDWTAYVAATEGCRQHFFSARARATYLQAPFAEGDHVVFGCETKGLPPQILNGREDSTYRIPILQPHVRSLNLSNAVSIVLYEGLRRLGALDPA